MPAPQAFDKYIIHPALFSVYADLDTLPPRIART